MRFSWLLRGWVSSFLVCAPASAQAVIATHSGTVNFSEGEVFLDDHPLDQKAATFPAVKEGSTLRTENGRAEILLEPSVFLRVDQNSAIQMVSTDLAKTRIVFLKGALILDSSDRPAGSSLALAYKAYEFRFPKPGVYRINAEPGLLETYAGQAEVTGTGQPGPQKVDSHHEFFFDIGMLTPKYGDGTLDNFSEWARQRSDIISAANRAEQDATDPADITADPVYGVGPTAGGGVTPGLAGVTPGYGGITTVPLTVGPAYPSSYGAWSLYGSAWGAPFLFPNTFIYVLPVYYHRYPYPGRWTHRSAYPALPAAQVGAGYLHSPVVPSLPSSRGGIVSPAYPHVGIGTPHIGVGINTPRVGVGAPRVGVTGPRYSAPATVHTAIPHVVGHR